MTLTYRVVTSAIKGLLRILCRVDDAQLTRVPDRGPLIIVANHVNFLLDAGEVKVTRQVRQLMVDEIMYQVAALLPPAYRGVCSNLAAATEIYLRFPPGVESNLRRRRVGTAEATEGH